MIRTGNGGQGGALFALALLVGTSVTIASCARSDARTVSESTEGIVPSGTYFDTAEPSDWTLEEVLPLTCLQVWEAYGDNDQDIVDIVVAMAGISMLNRELDFPETEEAGLDVGRGVLAGCAEDRDDLMYAIVDRSMRRVTLSYGLGGR